jgi:hypothetical protein
MRILLFVVLISLTACASENEKKAFNLISEYFGTKVSYTKGFSKEVGRKDVDYISLALKGGEYVSTIASYKLSACAAMLFYTQMDEKELNKYSHIKISIFNNDTAKVAKYTNTYQFQTIKDIAIQSESFYLAAQKLQSDSTIELYNLLPEQYRSASVQGRFVKAVEKMKMDRGGIDSVKLVGISLVIDHTTKERYLNFTGMVKWKNNNKTPFVVATSEDHNIKGVKNFHVK